MLVLTRKVGETITIGDDIRVTLVDIRGKTVRLGIAAPAEVAVDRLEVHERRSQFAIGKTSPEIERRGLTVAGCP